MNRFGHAVLSVAFLASTALLPVRGAHAAEVAAEDAKAVHAVVAAQLAAFAADDAPRAFSYAAPAIREMFGTADRFLAMVRASYPVVYRPSTLIFLTPQWVQGQLVQGVHLTDAGGALWLAVYRLDRQPDHTWRISDCDVQRTAGKLT